MSGFCPTWLGDTKTGPLPASVSPPDPFPPPCSTCLCWKRPGVHPGSNLTGQPTLACWPGPPTLPAVGTPGGASGLGAPTHTHLHILKVGGTPLWLMAGGGVGISGSRTSCEVWTPSWSTSLRPPCHKERLNHPTLGKEVTQALPFPWLFGAGQRPTISRCHCSLTACKSSDRCEFFIKSKEPGGHTGAQCLG